MSSLVQAARYYPEERALELCFASGRRYLYLGVPAELADAFQLAPSKGGYFNRAIRGRFACRELKPERRRVAASG